MNKDKKLKKQLKKSARKQTNRSVFEQAEFSNSSPMRGTAYVEKGVNYGW